MPSPMHTATATQTHTSHNTPPEGTLPSTLLLLVGGNYKWRPQGRKASFQTQHVEERKMLYLWLALDSVVQSECEGTGKPVLSQRLNSTDAGVFSHASSCTPDESPSPITGGRQAGQGLSPKRSHGQHRKGGGAKSHRASCWGGAHRAHLPADASSAPGAPQQLSKPASLMAIWFFQAKPSSDQTWQLCPCLLVSLTACLRPLANVSAPTKHSPSQHWPRVRPPPQAPWRPPRQFQPRPHNARSLE